MKAAMMAMAINSAKFQPVEVRGAVSAVVVGRGKWARRLAYLAVPISATDGPGAVSA